MPHGQQVDANLQRDESLYFDDGDIVLAAPTKRQPSSIVLFRVDKIFLARNSPIFRDMLSFSPGHGPQDTYDGVPRVEFTDEAEDLQGLLGAMYNVATLPLRRFDPDKPRLLMGTMRLAIKYEVDGIRDVILRSVEEDWPRSPQDYGIWLAERSHVIQTHPKDWWLHVPEPAAAIQFAAEFGLSEIAPGILYHMATLSTTALLPVADAETRHWAHFVRWHLLDASKFFQVVAAQELLKSLTSDCAAYAVCGLDRSDCGDCRLGLEIAFRDYIQTDVMQPFSLICETLREAGGICPSCLHAIEHFGAASYNTYQIRVWANMHKCVNETSVPWPTLDANNEQTI